jgi:two-component system sensor histidine kinase EvgS
MSAVVFVGVIAFGVSGHWETGAIFASFLLAYQQRYSRVIIGLIGFNLFVFVFLLINHPNYFTTIGNFFNNPESLEWFTKVFFTTLYSIIITFATATYRIFYRKTITDLIIAKERASHADKLKTAFLRNISHEIRTPMNSILGFSQLINKNGIPLTKYKSYSKMISNHSMQLMSVIDNVLDMSILESGEIEVSKEKICFRDIIKDVVAMHKEEIESKNLKIVDSCSIARIPETSLTDKKLIKKVINNIFGNAVKYTASGVIAINCNYDDSNLNVIIQDTGPGIEPEIMQNIYNAFNRDFEEVKEFKEGIGLGIPISKKILEVLGGDIKIYSNNADGTEVNISVPI